MAKIEELMALMIDEINRYEQLVKKMEKLQQTKFEIDVSKLENMLKSQEEQMSKRQLLFNSFQLKMENLIKNAKIYPKWAVIIFVGSLFINCGLIIILYCFYK